MEDHEGDHCNCHNLINKLNSHYANCRFYIHIVVRIHYYIHEAKSMLNYARILVQRHDAFVHVVAAKFSRFNPVNLNKFAKIHLH
jgi:hypothetical protein